MQDQDKSNTTSSFTNMTLSQGLGRVEGKIDILLTQFSSHDADDRREFDGIHKYLRSIDSRINWAMGVGTAIIFGITLATHFIK